MKNASPAPKLHLLRSVVADARTPIGAGRPLASPSHGLEPPPLRHDLPHPAMDAAGPPLVTAPVGAFTAKVGVGPMPATRLDVDSEAESAGPRPTPAFVDTPPADARKGTATALGDLGKSPSADATVTAPAPASTTAQDAGRGASPSGYGQGNWSAGQARPAWDIVHAVARKSPTVTAGTLIPTASPEGPRLERSPALQHVGAAQSLGSAIAARMQALSRPDFSMPDMVQTEAGRIESAAPMQRLEAQAEARPVWREAAWAAFRAPPLEREQDRHDAPARSPDVHIGHVDVTVISTDPPPQKPPPRAAPVAPGSSLASLHYLRRF